MLFEGKSKNSFEFSFWERSVWARIPKVKLLCPQIKGPNAVSYATKSTYRCTRSWRDVWLILKSHQTFVALYLTKLSWVWVSANLQDFFPAYFKVTNPLFHMDGALNYVFSFFRLQLEKRINFNYMPVFTRPAWLREKLATRWYNLRWALVWAYVFLVIDSHFSFRGIHQPVEL